MTIAYSRSKQEILDELERVVKVWKDGGNWQPFWETNYQFVKRVLSEEVSDDQEELQARFLAEGYFGIKGTTRKDLTPGEVVVAEDEEEDNRQRVSVKFRCRECGAAWSTEMLRANYRGEEISALCESCDVR